MEGAEIISFLRMDRIIAFFNRIKGRLPAYMDCKSFWI